MQEVKALPGSAFFPPVLLLRKRCFIAFYQLTPSLAKSPRGRGTQGDGVVYRVHIVFDFEKAV
jgi:hypothetical protein